LCISHTSGQIEKYPGIAAGGIQVEVTDKMLGSEVQVLMNVRQQSESGQQDKQPFHRFKGGYDTKTAFCPLMFHNVFYRENSTAADFGKHRAYIYYSI